MCQAWAGRGKEGSWVGGVVEGGGIPLTRVSVMIGGVVNLPSELRTPATTGIEITPLGCVQCALGRVENRKNEK